MPYAPKQPKISKEEKCVYCGEESAQQIIMNPNLDTTIEDFWWKVCNNCDEIIQAYNQLSMAISFGEVAENHGFGEKAEPKVREQINEAKSKIKKIEERTRKKVLSVGMTKTESGYEARDLMSGEEL